MDASEISTFLSTHGIRLNTDLGQHFLVDPQVLEDIVEVAEIHTGERILEIGPGIGVLTRELLHRGADVTCIELDATLIPLLREFVGKADALTVVQGNALHAEIHIDEPYKVVANIPYHITSPLLRRFLLELPRRPQSMTLLIQREVAENICADTTVSILTLLVHIYGEPTLVRTVRKEAFLPPPEVESAVLHIQCYENPRVPLELIDTVLKIAKHAMSQRRKMLRKTIGSLTGGEKALQEAGIDGTRRPETLTVTEWTALARRLL